MGDSAFTRYVALLHPVPGLTADIPAIRAHVAWLRSLQAAGSLDLAGPFADGSGGMVILRAESAAEAVSYADVTAPYGGTIAARHVQPGELVAPGAALFDIVAPGRLRVVVDVPQTVAASLRIDPRATVLSGDRRIAAAAVRVFGSVAPQSGTVRVWADLPADATGLMAGQFVGIALPSGGATELAVPPSALVERSEVTAVYVVAPDGSVALRQVRVGHRRADSVEILAGLSRGERVVTDPLAALRLLSGSGRNTRP